MALYTNRLDITLTAEQLASVRAAVATLNDALPFLVSMSAAERRHLAKLGPKSESFVRQTHELAREHPEILPNGLSVADLDRDQAIRDALLPTKQDLELLLRKVNDTMTLAGADLMQGTLIIYRGLRSYGDAAGYGPIREELGRRFEQTRAPLPGEEPEGAIAP
jgi:hypothetical protein